MLYQLQGVHSRKGARAAAGVSSCSNLMYPSASEVAAAVYMSRAASQGRFIIYVICIRRILLRLPSTKRQLLPAWSTGPVNPFGKSESYFLLPEYLRGPQGI